MSQLPYRQLEVWQAAMDLAVEIAELTSERGWRPFMRDQACRAAFSIAANIAEGNGRSTPLDYASFIDRARGSLFELDTWLIAAARTSAISEKRQLEFQSRLEVLSVRLYNLARSLRSRVDLPSRN